MSTSQEKSNMTVMPVPDATMVSDGKDKEVINLEAVAREAAAKLERDLADAKVRNNGIVWKKKDWADWQAVVKKKKEEDEAAEAQRKADEDAKKKGSEQPPVSFTCLLFRRPEG